MIGRPPPRLDVTLHQVLAEVVVDHVAPVLIDEPDALPRAVYRDEGEGGQPLRRLVAVDRAIEVPTGRFIARVVQLLHQFPDLIVTRRALRTDSGQREEDLSLEGDPL